MSSSTTGRQTWGRFFLSTTIKSAGWDSVGQAGKQVFSLLATVVICAPNQPAQGSEEFSEGSRDSRLLANRARTMCGWLPLSSATRGNPCRPQHQASFNYLDSHSSSPAKPSKRVETCSQEGPAVQQQPSVLLEGRRRRCH